MLWIFSIAFLFLSAPFSLGFALLDTWQSEESVILEKAQKEKKIILAAFIAEDCPWSKKMAGEILSQSDFLEKVEPQAVLWRYSLHLESEDADKLMRDKYSIQAYPLLLLLDPQGREFARFGYAPAEPREFAEEIVSVVVDFKEVCSRLAKEESLDAKEWLSLYRKTDKLSSRPFKKMLLDRAERDDPSVEILLEKYAFLLETNKIKDGAVQKIRKELLQRDPENHLGTHFKIAMTEFQSASSKSKKSAKKIMRPLLKYLEQYENKDKDNAWRAQLAIAQRFFIDNALTKALEFARKAYEQAPSEAKKSIAEAIAYIESEVK